jgi:hypothetical protein
MRGFCPVSQGKRGNKWQIRGGEGYFAQWKNPIFSFLCPNKSKYWLDS